MNDPIADMLTRIRNALRAQSPEVVVPHSKLKEGIARLLKKEGYLAEVLVEGQAVKTLKLKLKYQGKKSILEGVRRISRPGLRRYVGVADIPRVRGGLGVAILSTPAGVLTGAQARKQRVGGELLCYVW